MLTYKYKKEIAAEYGCDRKTLYNRLRKYDLCLPRGILSPAQQKLIYEFFCYPVGINEDDYREIRDVQNMKD